MFRMVRTLHFIYFIYFLLYGNRLFTLGHYIKIQNGYGVEYEFLLESQEGFNGIREHKFGGAKISDKKIDLTCSPVK